MILSHLISSTMCARPKNNNTGYYCILCPMRAPGCNAPLIPYFGAIYIVCLFISFFLCIFLANLLPYLSFPLWIDPLHFQAGCRKRWLNLSLIFGFILLCCSTFLFCFDWRMRAFVAVGLVFSTPSQEIGLWKRLRNVLFCVAWDVKPQLNESTMYCSVASTNHLLSCCCLLLVVDKIPSHSTPRHIMNYSASCWLVVFQSHPMF